MFSNNKIINSGVWGNITDEAFNRIDTDVVPYNPSKVFLLIGINDIGRGRDNELIKDRIEKILLQIKLNCPYAKLYLISVYPINISDFDSWYSPDNKINETVDDLNASLEKLSDDLNITYIDVAKYLKNDKNELIAEYTVEGLHITDAGYEVITGVLEGYVE